MTRAQKQFVDEALRLRATGASIRSIADVLGTHQSRVERCLRAVERQYVGAPTWTNARHGSRSKTPFVGRELEMAVLNATLDGAFKGRGSLLMLTGEPGIGKTRLAQQVVSRAVIRGAAALRGSCHEGLQTPAYWPWAQAIGSYLSRHGGRYLLDKLGPSAWTMRSRCCSTIAVGLRPGPGERHRAVRHRCVRLPLPGLGPPLRSDKGRPSGLPTRQGRSRFARASGLRRRRPGSRPEGGARGGTLPRE